MDEVRHQYREPIKFLNTEVLYGGDIYGLIGFKYCKQILGINFNLSVWFDLSRSVTNQHGLTS